MASAALNKMSEAELRRYAACWLVSDPSVRIASSLISSRID
jgi:hypothetical protein